MHPILGNALIRPENSSVTVNEIVVATLSMATQARKAYGLDLDRLLIVTPPYDEALRESWHDAEKALAEHPGGRKIRFDWSKWDVWTIERPDLGGGVPAEWLIKPGDGLAIVPGWVVEPLNPGQLRDLAAGAMAMADYLEKNPADDLTIEGGL